jgi:DivIVA domain-containing protein
VIWVWVLLIVVLIGAVAVIGVGRGDAMSEVYDDRPDRTIPSGRALTSDDLREVRFTTAVRGYRMDEVDAFMARLGADLLARETRDASDRAVPPAEPAADEDGAVAAGSEVRAASEPAEPAEPAGWLTQPEVPPVPDLDPKTLKPRDPSRPPVASDPAAPAEGQHLDGPSHRA